MQVGITQTFGLKLNDKSYGDLLFSIFDSIIYHYKIGGLIMTKVAAWRSVRSGIHHNDTARNSGNKIKRENRQAGKGGKPLCKECSSIVRGIRHPRR